MAGVAACLGLRSVADTGGVIEGHPPANAARLVRDRALAHRRELDDNWQRARANMPLVKIAGLDDD
jgi:hypothetical protein